MVQDAEPLGDLAAPAELTLVLDTNIVLDLFIFDDVQSRPLRAALSGGGLHWLATRPMREELERVLGYDHIAARLAASGQLAADVLTGFDRHARLVDVPDRAPLTCADPNDQMFIDLAVRHQCTLLSKDNAVLALRKRLACMQVNASAALPASSYSLSQGHGMILSDHNTLGTAPARKS